MSKHNCQLSTIEQQYKALMDQKPETCPSTANLYGPLYIPKRFDCPHLFQGYGIQNEKPNPFYRTVSSDYGRYTPNAHTIPHRYFPKSQTFSTHLAKCGMYRNYSLNTVMDKSFY